MTKSSAHAQACIPRVPLPATTAVRIGRADFSRSKVGIGLMATGRNSEGAWSLIALQGFYAGQLRLSTISTFLNGAICATSFQWIM
jgi:hypothetical protein